MTNDTPDGTRTMARALEAIDAPASAIWLRPKRS